MPATLSRSLAMVLLAVATVAVLLATPVAAGVANIYSDSTCTTGADPITFANGKCVSFYNNGQHTHCVLHSKLHRLALKPECVCS